MYIKQIIIKRFKSYKGCTVIGPFHPKENVIVSCNEPAKSDLINAIEFILSDKYERQALFSEGFSSGSASVEITFDNADGRIAIDSKEVSIKRVIGNDSCHYILNQIPITKEKCVTLMESAGLFQLSHYTVVQQRKIDEIALNPETCYKAFHSMIKMKLDEVKRDITEDITQASELESLMQNNEELEEYKHWIKKVFTLQYIVQKKNFHKMEIELANLKIQHTELQLDVERALVELSAEECRSSLSKNIDKQLVNRKLINMYSNRSLLDKTNKKIERIQEELKMIESKDRRKGWLAKELSAICKQVHVKLMHVTNIEINMERTKRHIFKLEKSRDLIVNDMKRLRLSHLEYEKQCVDVSKKMEEGSSTREQLSKKADILQNELQSSKEKLKATREELTSVLNEGVPDGITSVLKVLCIFKQRPSMVHKIKQYRGLLIDNLRCESMLNEAVEATAGEKLFYHIIETENFALEILNEINVQDLPGVVQFFPLDNLQLKQIQDDPMTYGAVALKPNLEYMDALEMLMSSVFDNVYVTHDVQLGIQIARRFDVNSVTFGGDQVSARGLHMNPTVTYRDPEVKSPMRLREEKIKLEQRINSISEELPRLRQEMEKVVGEVSLLTKQFQDANSEYETSKDTYKKLSIELDDLKKVLHDLDNTKIHQEKILLQMQYDLNFLKSLRIHLEIRMDQELNNLLSEKDQLQIDDALGNYISILKDKLNKLLEGKKSLETKTIEYQHLLNKNLDGNTDKLDSKLQEISLENKLLLQELEDWFYEDSNTKKHCTEKLENLSREWKAKQKTILDQSIELEKLHCSIKRIEENLEIDLNLMNILGMVMSSDLYAFHSNMSINSVDEELEFCKLNLKTYDHVAKKVQDYHEALRAKKEEQQRAGNKSCEVLQYLQHKKMFYSTFDQISESCKSIFNQIFPGRHVQLVLKSNSLQNGSNSSFATNLLDLEEISGIGISVDSAEHTATQDINNISEVEKSLLALILFFSLQKKTEPFYVLDGIDGFLNIENSRAMSQVLSELSAESQFIITTSRSEQLEKINQCYRIKMRNLTSSKRAKKKTSKVPKKRRHKE